MDRLASISVFLKPISLDFGWSRGETSFAYTVASFSAAFFGILCGDTSRISTELDGLVLIGAVAMSLSSLFFKRPKFFTNAILFYYIFYLVPLHVPY